MSELLSIRTPTATTISPDGCRVVFSVTQAHAETDGYTSTLWTVAADGSERAKRMTDGSHDSAPVFAPQGDTLAFLRVVDGAPHVVVIDPVNGTPRQLTDVHSFPFGVSAPQFSPDGSTIAVMAPAHDPGAPRKPGEPLVADTLNFKFDGVGRFGTMHSQLFSVDVGTFAVTQLTEGPVRTGTPAWSPDGRRIAFCAPSGPDADLTFAWQAHYIDLDHLPARPIAVGTSSAIMSSVLWDSTSSTLSAVGMASPGVGDASLWSVSLQSGTPDRLITSTIHRNIVSAAPVRNPLLEDEVLILVRERGWTHLHSVRTSVGTTRPLVTGEHQVVSAVAVSSSTPLASYVVADQQSFGEVAVLDTVTGESRTLTALTSEHYEGPTPLVAELRAFNISDGTVVDGWLLRGEQTTGPGPLLLDIHGGPHDAFAGRLDEQRLYQQQLAREGWSILTLNVRGSDGYGSDFQKAILRRWGYTDMPDFLEPIDALVAEGIADPHRLAVVGFSYGGYMTCFLTSHDQRFAAAIAGCPVSDLTSMPGASDIGQWLIGAVVGLDPVAQRIDLAELSPINHARQVTTPTLILHGEADQRVPVHQGEQWFAALRSQQVPARLVVYPGGTHAFNVSGTPSHRIDMNTRIVEWLTDFVPEAGGSPRTSP